MIPRSTRQPSRKRRPIRYAVVGLGHLAQVAVLPAFHNARRNSSLVTVVSGNEEKLRAIQSIYGLKTTYTYDQYDTLLSSNSIDAVYLALPNHLHQSFVVRALRAGIHVLCEKPLALTARSCRVMMRATSRSDALLMVAYRLHFEKANLDIVELARSGQLGKTRIFHSLFTQQVKAGDTRLKAEIGGGPLLDIGIYCINAARYLFQAEPTEVFAMAASGSDRRFREVNEMHGVVMRFPGDRLATFTASFGASDRAEFDIVGTTGSARLESAYRYSTGMQSRVTVGTKSRQLRYAHGDQFGPQLLYFSNCILTNRRPEPSGTEGLIDAIIIDALHRSARSGRVVKLPSRLEKKERPSKAQLIHCSAVKKPRLVETRKPTE